MMKAKIYWLFFCLLLSASLLEAQDNPTLKWLQERIGEWEAVNNSGENPAIEAYRHEYEPILGGQGILFRSKLKIKDQGWITALTALWGSVAGTDKLYALAVPAKDMGLNTTSAEGALVDNSFKLQIFDLSGKKALMGDFLYTGTGDEYKLHGIQFLDGSKTPLPPLVFKKIK